MIDRTPLDLDDIEARAAHLYEYGDPTDTRTAGWEELAGTDVPALLAEVRRLTAELADALRPNTPRLCKCGHSNHAHTVPAPHSCFAFGKTCPCEAFQQLPHDEAVSQLARNVEAAERRRLAGEQPAAEGAQR
ncbi:hypothetical protein [Streptomyces sp. NPDC102487]|uniref:hypothetical protein n=1 Tax=Streptomyces sp. NPDC102487 TaxID=3366182 RepID=UPI003829194F